MNCRKCIDCQRMIGPSTGGGSMVVSWRCYGEYKRGGPAKRDLNEGTGPPPRAPDWCPRRGRK